MNNIETLKLELLKQKEVIEEMGGYVTIANNNPSPSEITEGIKTVTGSLDLTVATAIESDVTLGKTFYAGDSKLRTGTNQSGDFYRMYIYGDCQAETLTTPEDVTQLRNFMFAGINCSSKFIINNLIESIGEQCFAYATLGDLEFEANSSLKSIGYEAFNKSNIHINYSRLPDTIQELGIRPFYQSIPTSDGFLKIPKNLAKVGQYGLSSYTYYEYSDELDWNGNTSLTATGQNMFYNQSFVGELNFPPTITKLSNSSFYNCRCNKVIFPATILNMDSNVYCISSSYYPNVPKLDVIFEGINPPTFGACPFYFLYKIVNLSIYVPDESYETYKSISYLSAYVDNIKRMSELPE